jgi:hypothetical protein
VQESQDYRLPNITIKQSAALECNAQLSGETKTQTPLSFQNQNTFGSGAGNTISRVLYTITADIIKLFTSSNAPSAKIVGTGQNPFTGHAAALSAGCATSSDLNAVSYATDEQKETLRRGQFVNSMYRQVL